MADVMAVLFGSKARTRVVAWLFSHPDSEFYVTELARATGLPKSNLSAELRRLAAAGVLKTRKVGVQRYFSANRDLPIFEELRGIAIKTTGAADVLREALADVAGIEVAFIYGSIASGEATAESDIDLMIVGKARFADVVAALEGMRERLGRAVSPRVYDPSELRRRAAGRNGFISEVLRGDKIFIMGDAAGLREAMRGQGDATPQS